MGYVNLQGTYPSLIDGNLHAFTANTDPVTLVIGTASSGFTSEMFVVNDMGSAISEFGRTSEVTRGIVEARDGGARNIVAVRLPGTAPVLSRVGAEHWDADAAPSDDYGFTITPVLASDEAGSRYGIAYRHARNYAVAGTGAADANIAEGELVVVDLDSEELVWYGSMANGAAIEDRGLMDIVFGADGIYNPATTSGPEKITLTFANNVGGADGTFSVGISGVTVGMALDFDLPDTPTLVGDHFVTAFNATVLDVCFTAVNNAGTVTITANGTVDSVSGNLEYPTGHPNAGATARLYVSAPPTITTSTGLAVTLAYATDNSRCADIGVFPEDPYEPFGISGGGTYVALEDVVAAYDAVYDPMAAYTAHDPAEATFVAGDNGTSISLMERYEKLDTVYDLLDFKDFDVVLPQGIKLDAPDNMDDSSYAFVPATDSDYPVPGSANDRLYRVHIIDDAATSTRQYFWATRVADAATLASTGDTAGYAGTSFNAVNFAHQLAKFCYESSSNYQSCIGIVPTSLPASLSPKGIKSFFGTVPTYTYDAGLAAYVIADADDNGTGLLGNKLVGGRFGYYMDLKHGGLPLTTSGFADTSTSEANLVMDENDKVVDLGKYIIYVPAFGHLRNEYRNTTGGYMTNLGNFIGGRLSSLPVNTSIDGQVLNGVSMRYMMPDTVADAAVGCRLICLINDEGSPTVAGRFTGASLTSDYSQITTMRIISKFVEDVRKATKGFLGKGLSTPRRQAMETAIGGVVETNVRQENIQKASYATRQTASQKVAGVADVLASVTPVFTLNQINLRISLNADA